MQIIYFRDIDRKYGLVALSIPQKLRQNDLILFLGNSKLLSCFALAILKARSGFVMGGRITVLMQVSSLTCLDSGAVQHANKKYCVVESNRVKLEIILQWPIL